jgi:DNA-binding NarL/FixJ family response regulator
MRVLVVDDHALFREGLRMLLGALDARLTSRELGISDGTVKTHLSVIFRELGVQTRTRGRLCRG